MKTPKLKNSKLAKTKRVLYRHISVAKNVASDGNIPASVSFEDVQKWYYEINDHLKKTNHSDVLEASDRVFNMKEVHFSLSQLCPVN